MQIETLQLLREYELTGLLERICQGLELSPSQFKEAEAHYQAVGNWLSSGNDPLVQGGTIYPQGSVALGTTVRPLGRAEHDIDLVAHFARLAPVVQAAVLKAAIGRRLGENAVYRDMLEEKPRCWRLHYAGNFHLDITPSILNPLCQRGGDLVPDKKTMSWKPSNPKGYRDWFEERSELRPQLVDLKQFAEGIRAQIEALPAQTPLKGILKRTVQLLKRHRDLYFADRNPDLGPISVIVTTLAAHSYEACVRMGVYQTELQVVLDVVRHLPDAIQTYTAATGPLYWIPNPTTEGENFAEKWNLDTLLAESFFVWHRAAITDLEELLTSVGEDSVRGQLAESFGEKEMSASFNARTTAVTTARAAGLVAVAPNVGVGVATSPGSVRSARQTFFGR